MQADFLFQFDLNSGMKGLTEQHHAKYVTVAGC